jgi:hypothetical protein
MEYRKLVWQFKERPLLGLALLTGAAAISFLAGGVVGFPFLWFLLLVGSWAPFFLPVEYVVRGDSYVVRVGGVKVREGNLGDFARVRRVKGGLYFLHIPRRSVLNVYRGFFLPCDEECDSLIKLFEEVKGGRESPR